MSPASRRFATSVGPARTRPPGERLRALEGEWELDDRLVRLAVEPESGVLLAVDEGGERLNPMSVISRGRKRSGV